METTTTALIATLIAILLPLALYMYHKRKLETTNHLKFPRREEIFTEKNGRTLTKEDAATNALPSDIAPILTHKISTFRDGYDDEDEDDGDDTSAHTHALGITIVAISDTHGHHRQLDMPKGDVLIHAGDYTLYGKREHADDFNAWLGEIKDTFGYQHIFVVNGNHECNAPWKHHVKDILTNATLLIDEFVQVEVCVQVESSLRRNSDKDADCDDDNDNDNNNDNDNDNDSTNPYANHILKIYGTNFSWPILHGPNPIYDRIHPETDILIVHGPAEGYVDKSRGCPALTKAVRSIQPKIVVSGHMHHARGVVDAKKCDFGADVTFVNAATAGYGTMHGHAFGKQPIVLQL